MVKNPPANAGDVRDEGLIPGSGRFPAEGNHNPPQYSCLENSRDKVAWWAVVHGVTKNWTQLVTKQMKKLLVLGGGPRKDSISFPWELVRNAHS